MVDTPVLGKHLGIDPQVGTYLGTNLAKKILYIRGAHFFVRPTWDPTYLCKVMEARIPGRAYVRAH